jgi:hypothetical protein
MARKRDTSNSDFFKSLFASPDFQRQAQDAIKEQSSQPIWRAYGRFMAAMENGTLPEGVPGSVAMDHDAGQIVIYVDREDEQLREQIRAIVGDAAWRTTLGTSSDDEDDEAQQFLGAYYSSEGIGDNIVALAELSDELAALVEQARVGEVDGLCDEGDEQAIFTYGPDADALLAVMEPLLRRFPVRPARVELRYGGHDDPDAREREILL